MAPDEMAAANTAATEKKDPLSGLEGVIGQIRESSVHLILVLVETARVRVRNAMVRIVAMLLGACLLAVASTAAIVLALIGAAQGVAALLEAPPWAGYLVVGGGAIVLLLVGVQLMRLALERRWFEATRDRIAARQDKRGQAK